MAARQKAIKKNGKMTKAASAKKAGLASARKRRKG